MSSASCAINELLLPGDYGVLNLKYGWWPYWGIEPFLLNGGAGIHDTDTVYHYALSMPLLRMQAAAPWLLQTAMPLVLAAVVVWHTVYGKRSTAQRRDTTTAARVLYHGYYAVMTSFFAYLAYLLLSFMREYSVRMSCNVEPNLDSIQSQKAQQLMLIIVTAVTTRVLLHRTLLRVLPSISITRASCSALLLLYSSHYHTSGQLIVYAFIVVSSITLGYLEQWTKNVWVTAVFTAWSLFSDLPFLQSWWYNCPDCGLLYNFQFLYNLPMVSLMSAWHSFFRGRYFLLAYMVAKLLYIPLLLLFMLSPSLLSMTSSTQQEGQINPFLALTPFSGVRDENGRLLARATFRRAAIAIRAIHRLHRRVGSKKLLGADGLQQGSSTSTSSTSTTGTLSRSSSSNPLVCAICLDEVPSVLIEPCNHLCLCEQCAREIAMRFHTSSAMRQCPMCKAEIARVRRVYYS